MNKNWLIITSLIILSLIFGFLIFTQKKRTHIPKVATLKNENVCKTKVGNNTIYLDYCPNQTKWIRVNLGNSTKYKMKYKHILLIFDPNGTGNYTVATLNLYFSLSKWLIPVCNKYYKKCNFYLISINNTTAIFKPVNQTPKYDVTFEADLSKVLPVYLVLSNKTLVYEMNGSVYIEGNNSTIRLAADRFVYWWYGIDS